MADPSGSGGHHFPPLKSASSMGGMVVAVEEQNNKPSRTGRGAVSEGFEDDFVSVASYSPPQMRAAPGAPSQASSHAVTIGPPIGPPRGGGAAPGWGQMQQHNAAQHPTRSQQVQPVLLPPVGPSPYSIVEGGDRRPLGQQQQQQQQLGLRRGSSRFQSFKSSAARKIDSHLKHGMGSFVLLWATSAVLLFLFLQELVFNFTSFNGRCIGPVLYPPWTEPPTTRMPRLVSFGYGACETNLGLRESAQTPAAAAATAEAAATDPNVMLQQLFPSKRCSWGICAGDRGWPSNLVKNGARAANPASSDSPNSRILTVLGALDTNLIRNYGEVYRIFWASFLHGGWVHLAINILCQAAVLFILEPVWGFWRCLLTWVISAMSGNLLSGVFDPCTSTVGSSGALYGLLGGLVPFAVENWDFLNYPWCVLAIVIVVIATAQLNSMGGFSSVDNFAHLGGCLGGLLFGFATIYTLRPIKRFSPSVWWARMRLSCCRCCLSPSKRERLSVQIRRYETKKRAELKDLREGGPSFSCCGFLEWIVRLVALACLTASLVYLWLYLLDPAYYEELKVPGRISFLGSVGCHCCRIPSASTIEKSEAFSRLSPYHTIRLNAGHFWCFENELNAEYFCGNATRKS
ncbi:rhomboid-like protease 5, putative [Eimeria brunetti]|uniref:Rhomboid-like protease n=1 Tax=Eimeria brunetti TaxID=51314 RepID=U6LT59_9EIME|nr:rhomboid-like protease 5, putative [Eimeria brunetti]